MNNQKEEADVFEQPLKTFEDYRKALRECDPSYDRYDVFNAWKQERDKLIVEIKSLKEFYAETYPEELNEATG